MTLREQNGLKPWQEWESEEITDTETLGMWKFIQYEFYTQWAKIKEYANSKGVSIIGDIRIYVSDDSYVKQQKEDIQELAQLFKGMLGENEEEETKEEFLSDLQEHFKGQSGISASYCLNLADENKNLIVEVKEEQLDCYYGEKKDVDVLVRLSKSILEDIIKGDMTLQRAFMSGEVTAKGDFKTLRNFDTFFRF